MKAFFAQVLILLKEHLRLPSYLVATLGFPTLFFVIFAVPEAKNEYLANFLTASFLAFAVIGVMFLQFAQGLAEENSHPWYMYLRTLPLTPWSFLLARMIVAAFMAGLTALTLIAFAFLLTPLSLSVERWGMLILHLIVGGFCFAFMGIALGVWISEKVALPLGNMIYLPMTYAGGLWKPPELLPDSVKTISKYLPSRSYGELLWSAVNGQEWSVEHYIQLSVWSVIFLGLATVGVWHGRGTRALS